MVRGWERLRVSPAVERVGAYAGLSIAASALVALAVYAAFIRRKGPVLIMETGTGIWLCALLIVSGFHVAHHAAKRGKDVIRLHRAELVYHGSSVALSLLAALFFGMFLRFDHLGLCVALAAVHGLALAVLRSRAENVADDGEDAPAPQCCMACCRPLGAACCGGCGEGGVWWWPSAAGAEEPETGGKRRGGGCGGACWCCSNVTLAVVSMLALVFLVVGSAVQGVGRLQYFPHDDLFATVSFAGRDVVLRVHCEGKFAQNSTSGDAFPTFLMEADGSHGAADFLPLQKQLTDRGYHSCAYDKPGLAFSGRYPAESTLRPAKEFYPALLDALAAERHGERFIIVGWGGGGEIAYDYLLTQGSKVYDRVSSIVYLDTFGDNIEWRAPASINGDSVEELNARKNADLSSRAVLFALIRGWAAPWGFIGLIGSAPAELYDLDSAADYAAYKWAYSTPMSWNIQWFSLAPKFDQHITFDSRGVWSEPLPDGAQGFPVVLIMEGKSKDDVCEFITDEAACDEQWKITEFMRQDQLQIANTTGHLAVYECDAADCGLDMVYRKPSFVASTIISHYA